jgi:hypothetical protein
MNAADLVVRRDASFAEMESYSPIAPIRFVYLRKLGKRSLCSPKYQTRQEDVKN